MTRLTARLEHRTLDELEAGFADRVGAYPAGGPFTWALFLTRGQLLGGDDVVVGARVHVEVLTSGGEAGLVVDGVVAWSIPPGQSPPGREPGVGVAVVAADDVAAARLQRMAARPGAGSRVRLPGHRLAQRLRLGDAAPSLARLGATAPKTRDARPVPADPVATQPFATLFAGAAESEADAFLHASTVELPAPPRPRLMGLLADRALGDSEPGGAATDSRPSWARNSSTNNSELRAELRAALEEADDDDDDDVDDTLRPVPATQTLPTSLAPPTTSSSMTPPELAVQLPDEPAPAGFLEAPTLDGPDEPPPTSPPPTQEASSSSSTTPPSSVSAVSPGGDDNADSDAVFAAADVFAAAPTPPSSLPPASTPAASMSASPAAASTTAAAASTSLAALSPGLERGLESLPDAPLPAGDGSPFDGDAGAARPFESQSTDIDLLSSISANDIISLDLAAQAAQGAPLAEPPSTTPAATAGPWQGVDDLPSADADLVGHDDDDNNDNDGDDDDDGAAADGADGRREDWELRTDHARDEAGDWPSLELGETMVLELRPLPSPDPWPVWSDLTDARTIGMFCSYSRRGQGNVEMFPWPLSGTKRFSRVDPVPEAGGDVFASGGFEDGGDDNLFGPPLEIGSHDDPFAPSPTDPRLNVEGVVAKNVRDAFADGSDGDVFSTSGSGEGNAFDGEATRDEMPLPHLVVGGAASDVRSDLPDLPDLPELPELPGRSESDLPSELPALPELEHDAGADSDVGTDAPWPEPTPAAPVRRPVLPAIDLTTDAGDVETDRDLRRPK